ncbi:MAG: PAS domain S-box protein [Syntrophobacteraceae bacterium]
MQDEVKTKEQLITELCALRQRLAESEKDITERKLAEEALKESEERFKALALASFEGIAFTDGGVVIDANPQLVEMLRYDLSEIIGKPAAEMIAPEDRELVSYFMEAGYEGRYENRLLRKDRSTLVVETQAKHFTYRGRNVRVTAVRDISERRQAQQDLRDARDMLEQRVQERTSELAKANADLREIPSRLLAAQEEERKRIGSELHDSIGQTLVAIKFWIEVILKFRDQGDPETAITHLERFVPTLQRSIEETRNIYMGLRPTMLDNMGLLATLDWLHRECMKLYPECHIELKTEIMEEEIPERLRVTIFRIAQESLNNVAKHSKAEWVDISLSKNGGGIELVVLDNGVGMAPELILQATTARSLGLTCMRERTEFTGGSFSIESTPGKGTTIRACWAMQAEDRLQ